MKKTPWFPGDVVPVRRGWYERDHRKCMNYIDPTDRRISLDLWEPIEDPKESLYPGVWYVKEPGYWMELAHRRVWVDGINDASRQDLPWRGILKDQS